MKKSYIKALAILLVLSIIIFYTSCKKEKEDLTTHIALETYINNSGQTIQITRYLKNTPANFTVKKDSLFIIQRTLVEWSDTSISKYLADSAKIVFGDGKSYVIKDTSKLSTNFLNKANFKTSVSPSGTTHYFRYTFTTADYNLAK